MEESLGPRGQMDEILARLRRVEGQVRGIQRMIDEQKGCEDILTQLMAARGALDKVSLLILRQQMERCLLDPGEPKLAQLQRIVEFLLKLSPPGADMPAKEG